jgi:hypothetical protein
LYQRNNQPLTPTKSQIHFARLAKELEAVNNKPLCAREVFKSTIDKAAFTAFFKPKMKPPPQKQLSPPPPPLEITSPDSSSVVETNDSTILPSESTFTSSNNNNIDDNLNDSRNNSNLISAPADSNIEDDNNNINKVNTTTNNEGGGCVKMAPTASELRKYVDCCMENEKAATKSTKSCPTPLLHIAKYIKKHYFPPRRNNTSNEIPTTEQGKSAMDKYNALFPTGTMEFIIPKENRVIAPSPWYHSIEDTKIIFVCWELNYPNLFMPCTTSQCGGELIHERSNLSNREDLTPIFDLGSNHIWVDTMWYKCNCCNKRVAGNSGELLNSLPSHLADAYPVYPRYASANLHMTKKSTDMMEDLFLTYGNSEYFSRFVYQLLSKEYLKKINNYYQQNSFLQVNKAGKYPTLNEWVGSHYPDSTKYREAYQQAQQSNLTLSGVSDMDRYTREIQSVGCSVSFAQDHTMEMTKNYQRKEGYKACWTACNERGEIACAALVDSTKSSQYAHAAESLMRRVNFNPKVMYADTWPHLEGFWFSLMGYSCVGRLGLFHFMQRIIKTLRDSHIDYRKSIYFLRKAVYKYEENDYLRLMNSLKSGTMAKDGMQYSDKDIEEMQESGLWKKRYDKWLRKVIYNSKELKENLNNWFDRFKFETTRVGLDAVQRPPGGRKDPNNGKNLFTPDTRNAVEMALKSCEYIGDVLPIDDMYTPLPPSSHTKHGLNEWLSRRVESKLEGFHDPLSNYANTGVSSSLADILCSAGTARYNRNIQQKYHVAGMTAEERKELPSHFLKVPQFYNHGDLDMVNKTAAAVGVEDPPFPFVKPLPPDDGQRFFSQYFHQQKKRNLLLHHNSDNERCPCDSCFKNPVQLVHEDIWPKDLVDDVNKKPASKAGGIIKKKKRKQQEEEEEEAVSVAVALVEKVPSGSVMPMIHPPQLHNYGTYPYPMPPYCFPHPMAYGSMPFGLPPSYQQPVPATKKAKKQRPVICCRPFAEWYANPSKNGRPPHDQVYCRRVTEK